MLIYSLLNRHKITKFALMIFMILFALPIIGMVLQMFINELFFTWTSIALALLVIYIFLESTTGDIDYLTKLYSRNSYEKYVKHLIESEREFCVVFIDLDNFKYINDKFGHLEGDRALCEFSKILEKLSSPNKMVCRLAGDEFIVVLEVYDNIDEILERVQATMILSKEKTLNRLQFSYGYQCYKKGMTLDQLYVMVDEKMYKSKQSKEKTGY
jgi:diguanylate cyclase (GGDEF)-like protein